MDKVTGLLLSSISQDRSAQRMILASNTKHLAARTVAERNASRARDGKHLMCRCDLFGKTDRRRSVQVRRKTSEGETILISF